MRIEYAHGEHDAFAWPRGSVRIGAAADNDIRLQGPGIADHHVMVHQDARGLVLEVDPGAGRVYVNARPVRERALLRAGDSLGIGNASLRLVDDRSADAHEPEDTGAGRSAVISLRAVAGPWSGRVYALDAALLLGMDGPVAATIHADAVRLEPRGPHAWLDVTRSQADPIVRVNGHQVRQARLADGDQIVIGRQRFVLEVSAETRPPPVSPKVTLTEPDPGSRRSRRGELWWLIATAALVALVLAGVLLFPY